MALGFFPAPPVGLVNAQWFTDPCSAVIAEAELHHSNVVMFRFFLQASSGSIPLGMVWNQEKHNWREVLKLRESEVIHPGRQKPPSYESRSRACLCECSIYSMLH